MSGRDSPEGIKARMLLFRRHLLSIARPQAGDTTNAVAELRAARAYAKLALDNEEHAIEIQRDLTSGGGS